MAENWYFVQKGNRHGPVEMEVIEAMVAKNELKTEDFVWKKGFENWKKIKDIPEFNLEKNVTPVLPIKDPPPTLMTSTNSSSEKEISIKDLAENDRAIFIRIGDDRGASANDYGPFSLKQLKQLFNENRINGKSYVFTKGMREWKMLAELPEYQDLFQQLPPVIKDSDKRVGIRKPFVARLFIQNNKNLYEGICRDISIGGMQILIHDFKGTSGDKITINVHPENSDYHFTASGLVVRILEGNSGFSFRFQGLSDEAKRSIEKYVQEN